MSYLYHMNVEKTINIVNPTVSENSLGIGKELVPAKDIIVVPFNLGDSRFGYLPIIKTPVDSSTWTLYE